MSTKAIKKLELKFDDSFNLGSWSIPDPNDLDIKEAKEFIRISADVGWHICYQIACGAKSCEFIVEQGHND